MSSFQEFHTSGSRHAEETEAADLVAVADDLCRTGPMVWPNVASAAELQGAKAILTDLNVAALLALPMSDGEGHAGVLLLMQDTARAWHENETFVVRTIAEQAGMALRNLGLRRLVSNLSVTDAKSGLLSRSRYLDVIFGEARRSQEENSSLTTVLMQFGDSAALIKQFGQDAMEAMMQQIGRILAGHIRQNDFAFRYETATVALILGNTGEVNALQAVEKFRALMTGIHWPNQTHAVQFATGEAESVLTPRLSSLHHGHGVVQTIEAEQDVPV